MADVARGVVVMTGSTGGAEVSWFLKRSTGGTFCAGTSGMRSGSVGKWMTIMCEMDEKGRRVDEGLSLDQGEVKKNEKKMMG